MLHLLGNKLRPYLNKRLAQRIRREFPAAVIADVGAGDGSLARILLSPFAYDIQPQTSSVKKHNIYDPLPCQVDLVVCINVLEHLEDSYSALATLRSKASRLWINFTPWGSPFGGHEFSPFHLLGKTSGKIHTLGKNLFKLSTRQMLLYLCHADWTPIIVRSSYFPLIKKCDFLMWNVEIVCK